VQEFQSLNSPAGHVHRTAAAGETVGRAPPIGVGKVHALDFRCSTYVSTDHSVQSVYEITCSSHVRFQYFGCLLDWISNHFLLFLWDVVRYVIQADGQSANSHFGLQPISFSEK